MVARSERKPSAYADLEALPSNMVGELVSGVLYANPLRALPHAAAASAIGEELGPPFERGKGGPGGWIWFVDPLEKYLEVLRLDGDTYRIVATFTEPQAVGAR